MLHFLITVFIIIASIFSSNCVHSHYRGANLETWELGPFYKHSDVNPILLPKNDTQFFCPVRNESVHWEEKDVFNPAAFVRDGKVHLLYRAEDVVGDFAGTSRIGLALSTDGYNFEREPVPIFYPANDDALIYEWEGGCEDPRIVEVDDGSFIMTYTAYDGSIARLMVASSPDLRVWTKHGPAFKSADGGKYIDLWSKSGSIVTQLMSNGSFVAHNINGSYWMYWGDTNIFLASSTDLVNWTPLMTPENPEEILKIFGPRENLFDSDLVEPGPQAWLRETADLGWAIQLIYNSRNKDPMNGGDVNIPSGTYSAGQILFDPNDPSKVLERSGENFFRPEEDYEIIGQVDNVVFLEGLVYHRQCYFLYYGTADSKIAVASFSTLTGEGPCI